MNIKKVLKQRFSGIYDYHLHLLRKKKIKQIAKLKQLPKTEYPKMLAARYEAAIGHKLNWDNLQTYTEKMQWAKLYDKNPLKATLTDKYLVREWVEKTIGGEYLIPLLGVWDNFEYIDFSELPDRFVLKTNHGSGTNLIVKDKSKLNLKRAKRMFDDWMNIDYAYNSNFEMHYTDIKPKIIAEKYMETSTGELPDYKFLCFGGKPYYCWVDCGRFTNHTRNVYDLDWKLQSWSQCHPINEVIIEKPAKFETMVMLAQKLSEGLSHVRVDFYNIDGNIYFGEMTFTNASGIYPDEWDKRLGELWQLEMK
mgnify:FL=1